MTTLTDKNYIDLLYTLNKPILVLISGADNIGKSTLAKGIHSHFPQDSKVISISQSVKKTAEYFGYIDSLRKTDITHRAFIKDLTTLGSTFDKLYWAKRYMKECYDSMTMHGNTIFIADDMRYEEYNKYFIEYFEVINISLERGNTSNPYLLNTHFDYIVDNTDIITTCILSEYIMKVIRREVDKTL